MLSFVNSKLKKLNFSGTPDWGEKQRENPHEDYCLLARIAKKQGNFAVVTHVACT